MAKIRIQYRRGTAARWLDVNPVLASGEPGYEIDTGLEKIGDGSTPWSDLPYRESFAISALAEDLSSEESIIGPLIDLKISESGPGGSLNDSAMASLLEDKDSSSHGQVVEIVHDETLPEIDLVVLFNNTIA